MTDTPKRIQRKRTPGWRMPPNTVYVGRGSLLGNPFIVGSQCGIFDGKDGRPLGLRDQAEILIPALTLDQCIHFYREMIDGHIMPEMFPFGHNWIEDFRKRANWQPQPYIRSNLRRRNLACWCPLDQPCHADVLLEIANR